MMQMQRRGLAPLLAGLAMFGPFAIDTMFPAFPEISREFGANDWMMQQTLSAYLVAYAMMSLFHGPFSDTWGRRGVIVWSVVVFLAASIGCALAWSIESLLFFRVVQGLSAGAGQIVGRAIIRDLYEGPAAQRLMSNISMMFTIAPAVAPIVGGWMLALGHWRWIFWFLALWSLALCVACVWRLPETHPPERRVPLSLSELVKSYGAMMRDAHFWPLAIAGTVNFSAMFIYIASAPAFVMGQLKLGPQDFAWLFVPAVSGMFLGALASSRLAGKFDARRTVGIGYIVMLGASALNVVLCAWVLPHAMLPWSVLPIGLHAIGISLSFPTIALLVIDRFPTHRGGASSMQSFVALVFNAVLAGVVVIYLSDSATKLAVGSATLTVVGFVAWRMYRGIAKREAMRARADVV
jgi:DHA1 family bicyclomycin/chloramphenicol resistance-like MFS transporter